MNEYDIDTLAQDIYYHYTQTMSDFRQGELGGVDTSSHLACISVGIVDTGIMALVDPL